MLKVKKIRKKGAILEVTSVTNNLDKELLNIISQSVDDSKATDIVTINLKGKTDIADYMLVASGNSNRHVASIADNLQESLKKHGYKNIQIEGLDAADWVLVDAHDVIVHIFRPEVREFYKIEKMWEEIPALLSRQIEDL